MLLLVKEPARCSQRSGVWAASVASAVSVASVEQQLQEWLAPA